MNFSHNFFDGNRCKAIEDPALFTDFIFEGVLSFMEESCVILDWSRRQFRLSKKSAGLEGFHKYKVLCREFEHALSYVEKIIVVNPRLKKNEKLTMAARHILEKGTMQTVKKIMSSAVVNFLEVNEITESDIDLMLKKIRDYWSRFLQIYGRTRIDIVLKKNLM